MTQKELLKIIEQAKKENWEELDLSNKEITSLPKEIGNLSSLKELLLYDNQLKSIPIELGNLSNLIKLELENNQLISVPAELGNLSSLELLQLGNNQLTSIPAELGNLSNLTTLYLNDNQLTSVPVELGNLSNLTRLDLESNQLVSIPVELGNLSNLTRLDLYANQLTSIPVELGDLSNLRRLYLFSNQLTSIPVELGNLSNLRSLELSLNELTSIPVELGNLSNLTILDFSFNHLTLVPVELGNLSMLEAFNLSNNSLKDPPREIVAQGKKAVLDYLRAKGRGKQKQWVSKLVVVGQGGVGKTQMLRRLRNENFDPSIDSTHGIDINSLSLKHPKESGIEMELKAWDFGGQDIYHATHQFFFSNRSLFILVWNAVHEYEQGKLYKWLDNIKAIAPESPILIVATHIDQRPPDLPITQLQADYPQIKGHFGVSNSDDNGFDELKNAIAEQAAELPLMGQEWPKSWIDSANALREQDGLFISRQKIPEILKNKGVEEKESDTLLRTLHELGDILYFYEDEELKDTIILQPQWVAKEVGRVIDSKDVQNECGVFKRDFMDRLWEEVIDPGLRDRLLRLMEKFDLSYRIPDEVNKSLVVECLPLELKTSSEIWNRESLSEKNKEISMKFKLNAIPPGIPTWFMARSHRFTTGNHWRRGAILKDKANNWALVETNAHERFVQLTVRGPFPNNFFAVLKDGLENSLGRYPGLEITRKIPCPGHDNDKPCCHEFDHRQLLKAFEIGKPTIECAETFEGVGVSDLLLGWEIKTFEKSHDEPEQYLKVILSKIEEMQGSVTEGLSLLQLNFIKVHNSIQSQVDHACPSVFVLRELERQFLDKANQVKPYELQFYCEAPGCWHEVETAKFQFEQSEEWLAAIAPYANSLVKTLKLIAPLAGSGAGVFLDQEDAKDIKKKLDLMGKLLPKTNVDGGASLDFKSLRGEKGEPRQLEESALMELRRLLDSIDPAWRNRGLKRVLTPEGHYLWLCDKHAKEYRI
jgi:internalin A